MKEFQRCGPARPRSLTAEDRARSARRSPCRPCPGGARGRRKLSGRVQPLIADPRRTLFLGLKRGSHRTTRCTVTCNAGL
jgi:hypothetical protein